VTVDAPRLVLLTSGDAPSESMPSDKAPSGGVPAPGRSAAVAALQPRVRSPFHVRNFLVGLLSLVVLALVADYVAASPGIAIGVQVSAGTKPPSGALPGSGDELIYGRATGAGGQGVAGLEIGIVANHARSIAFLTTRAGGVFRQRISLPAGSYTVVASARSLAPQVAPALADLSIEPGGHYRIDVSETPRGSLLWFPRPL
jgi:hypothetical protein